jgi:hypothetical protein
VISTLAQRLVRRRVEAQMTAQIKILRGDLGAFDPTTGEVGGLANVQTIYQGMARIRTVDGAGVITLGEGTIDTRQTVISIPITAAMPHRDDLAQVLDDASADTDLTNRLFRITEVEGGSLLGDARRCYAVGWFPSRNWSPS